MKDRDRELQQLMAEEGSRGRRQPVRAITIEQKRRLRVIKGLLEDPTCDKRRFMQVIRDDLGLAEGSPEFHLLVKAWDELH